MAICLFFPFRFALSVVQEACGVVCVFRLRFGGKDKRIGLLWGLSGNREAEGVAVKSLLVGERCACSEAEEGTPRGVRASENVGISSEKTGENPVRRKPKVS